MSGLAEFLLARIAEDEAAARTRDMNAPIHFPGCYYYNNTLDVGRSCDCDDDGKATARVLAECEAKRRLVEGHDPVPDLAGNPMGCMDGDDWPCRTLRILALPYAAHPDYRDEWKP